MSKQTIDLRQGQIVGVEYGDSIMVLHFDRAEWDENINSWVFYWEKPAEVVAVR